MQKVTATNLRKNLFKVLETSAKRGPTQVVYKKGDSIVLSYRYYQNLLRRGKKSRKLAPLIEGKILKPLDEKSGRELLEHMGIK